MMETIKSKKVSSIFNDLNKKDYLFEQKQIDKLSDSKVKNLALNKILSRHFGKIYNLIEKSNANSIFKLFITLIGKPQNFEVYQNKYEQIKYVKENKKINIPIGINGPNWLNALIQFIIHVPNILNIFDFTPKSFIPFNLFFDSYEYDRSHDIQMSLNSKMLLECLYNIFPKYLFIKNTDKIDLYKILNLIMSTIFDEDIFNLKVDQKNINLLSFHPEWQIVLDANIEIDFENYLIKATNRLDSPKELIVSYRWFYNGNKKRFSKKLKPKKNIFLKNYFYELDAFIEYREDDYTGSYITYLKIDDEWFQCEDAKIKKIKSNNILIGLYRSILLHYRIIQKKVYKKT